jgi:choline kinase
VKAVLLAAGIGRRLGHDQPKAMLEVGGRTLLWRHLENLKDAGIPCRIVTGFMGDRLEPERYGAERVHNPDYARGSLLSLQCGLDGIEEDALVMDADVLYDPTILTDVSGLRRGFAIDVDTEPGDEEMMIGVKGGEVRAIRRGRLDGFDLVGEGVGFFKLDRDALHLMWHAIQACDPDGDYEAALDLFVAEHGADYVEVAGRPWTEIDFAEDLERAERDVLPRL